MKLRLAFALVLAGVLAISLGAQTTKQPAETKSAQHSESKELSRFRDFITQHPKAYAELKKDPSLISSSA